MIKKIIKLFHAKSLVHLIIIFIVFGITGSLSVILSEKVQNFLRIDDLITFYPAFLIAKLLNLLIVYQVCLLIIGTVFGQFRYFIRIQKKFLKRIRILR
jgi:hypothetical protein